MTVRIPQKNALQWTKNPSAAESGDMAGTPTASTASVGAAEGAEQESCDSTETTAASGENDGLWTICSFFSAPTIVSFWLFCSEKKAFKLMKHINARIGRETHLFV